MTLRLTNSEMATWRRCQRKWWLSVYRGLRLAREAPAGNPLTLGTTVHDALAAYYSPESINPLAYLDTKLQEALEVAPAYENDIRKEYELAKIMLEGYMMWLEESGADQDLKVLAPETMLEKEIVPGVTVLSKLDARVEKISTGHRSILEHKTTQSLTQALPLLQIDTQLLTEHLVEFLDLQERHGDEAANRRAEGVLYNMLRKVKRTAAAKPPFYGREEVSHNMHELRAHWHQIVLHAQQITAARAALDAGQPHIKVVLKNPNRNCTWDCPFLGICPMLDDGSDVEAAIRDNYRVADPLERYDNTTTWEEE